MLLMPCHLPWLRICCPGCKAVAVPAPNQPHPCALCSCGSLDEAHTKAALSWLAAFHAACWGADAAALGLWEEGCYWHLSTRWGLTTGLVCAHSDRQAGKRAG